MKNFTGLIIFWTFCICSGLSANQIINTTNFIDQKIAPVWAAKTAEFLPNYLWCIALHHGIEDESCEDLLTSAKAKGYGLSLEAWQKNENIYHILIAWLAGFTGVKFSQALEEQNFNIASSVVLATSANLLAKSHKNTDAEFWLLKVANLGTRFALEKKLADYMFSDALKASLSNFLLLFFPNLMSQRQKGISNKIIFSGAAKVVSSSFVFVGTQLVFARTKNTQIDWSHELGTVILLNFFQGTIIPLAIVFITPVTALAILLGYRLS